jgi:hypothetical protein
MTPGTLHYLQVLHQMRMRELIAEADRERRWRLQDEANDRPVAVSTNPLRALVARLSAVRARAGATTSQRLQQAARLDLARGDSPGARR